MGTDIDELQHLVNAFEDTGHEDAGIAQELSKWIAIRRNANEELYEDLPDRDSSEHEYVKILREEVTKLHDVINVDLAALRGSYDARLAYFTNTTDGDPGYDDLTKKHELLKDAFRKKLKDVNFPEAPQKLSKALNELKERDETMDAYHALLTQYDSAVDIYKRLEKGITFKEGVPKAVEDLETQEGKIRELEIQILEFEMIVKNDLVK